MKFRTILADPPWSYGNFSGTSAENGNGAADAHYSTMALEDLCALPVASVAEKDCALLMWCTWPHDEAGTRLIRAWGFEPKTGIPWIKMTRAGTPRVGIGWHHRSASEFLRVAIRGSLTPPVDKRLPAVIFNPIGRHSAKPEEQYAFAEAYGGPYLELFARPNDGGLFPPRELWTRIGNEITGRDIAEDLRLLAAQDEAGKVLVAA